MPRRPQPPTLRLAAIKAVGRWRWKILDFFSILISRHLERICYGCKNSHEVKTFERNMHNFRNDSNKLLIVEIPQFKKNQTLMLTESDAFLREEGPFVTFPPSLLEDLLQEVLCIHVFVFAFAFVFFLVFVFVQVFLLLFGRSLSRCFCFCLAMWNIY